MFETIKRASEYLQYLDANGEWDSLPGCVSYGEYTEQEAINILLDGLNTLKADIVEPLNMKSRAQYIGITRFINALQEV